MIIDYNSSEQVRSELIKILMNYLEEITDTKYPVGEEAVRTVPEVAKTITNLLYL